MISSILSHPVSFLALALLTCGLFTYQAATILMKGSIFQWLRSWAKANSERNWFAAKTRDMLGCLLCTGTEVALWCIGLPFVALALYQGWAGQLLGPMPAWLGVLIALSSGFIVSLAAASLGWAYKEFAEYRLQRFEELRSHYEGELARLRRQMASNGRACAFSRLETIFPAEAFAQAHARLPDLADCNNMMCPYRRTDCRIRFLVGEIREWWAANHGEKYASELETIAGVLLRSISSQDSLYALFWAPHAARHEVVYRRLLEVADDDRQPDAAFEDATPIT